MLEIKLSNRGSSMLAKVGLNKLLCLVSCVNVMN